MARRTRSYVAHEFRGVGIGMNLFPTPAFRHLRHRGLLRSYLESLGLEGNLRFSETLPSSVLAKLQEAGLAVVQSERPAVELPFLFVKLLYFPNEK